MTHYNKKANQNDDIDRISELPSNAINSILGNLKIQELVRTSILSRKWRHIWTSVPQLDFDQGLFHTFMHLDDFSPIVSKIITDVLMLHNGPIHKFSLFIPHRRGFKITMEYLNMWISVLSKGNVKYLDLLNYDTVPDEMPYNVFSCEELNYFKFGGFNLSVPPNICCFKRLLELHLISVTFESDALENLMSGCPILEKLNIEFCNGFEYLDISAPALKVFILALNHDMKSICLKKAKNLEDFTLKAFHPNKVSRVSGLIKSLPKVKRFSVIRGFFDDTKQNRYADIIPLALLTSSFSSLEYLKLCDVNLNEKRELSYIVSVLKSAPSLIELVIHQSYNNVDTSEVSNHSEELERHNCCYLKLQTVNIFVEASSQHTMSLIQFILANSTLLKTLNFNYSSENLDAPVLFRISQDLLLMERASPRAQVKFLHSTDPPCLW